MGIGSHRLGVAALWLFALICLARAQGPSRRSPVPVGDAAEVARRPPGQDAQPSPQEGNGTAVEVAGPPGVCEGTGLFVGRGVFEGVGSFVAEEGTFKGTGTFEGTAATFTGTARCTVVNSTMKAQEGESAVIQGTGSFVVPKGGAATLENATGTFDLTGPVEFFSRDGDATLTGQVELIGDGDIDGDVEIMGEFECDGDGELLGSGIMEGNGSMEADGRFDGKGTFNGTGSFDGEGSCEGGSVTKEEIPALAADEATPPRVRVDLPASALSSVAAAPGVAPGPYAAGSIVAGTDVAYGPSAAVGPPVKDLDEDVIDSLALVM